MGREYTPDNWVVIKLIHPKEGIHYRVLAGWSGGYAQSDSWRMNSGITSVSEDDNYYYFHGETGSCYNCNKKAYGLRMNNLYIWNKLKNLHDENVCLMDENTDWLTVKWKEND